MIERRSSVLSSLCCHPQVSFSENKTKKKKTLLLMEPVELYRDSMYHLLNDYISDAVVVTGVVTSLAEMMHSVVLNGPADIFMMEAFGQDENYKNWHDFTRFMSNNCPSSTCLVWSSKPTKFLIKLNTCDKEKVCWQIPKVIDINIIIRFMHQVICSSSPSSLYGDKGIAHHASDLTASEILIITGLMEGRSNLEIASKYKISSKTVSQHKRNAMTKLGVSTTFQLRNVIEEVYISNMCNMPHYPFDISRINHAGI